MRLVTPVEVASLLSEQDDLHVRGKFSKLGLQFSGNDPHVISFPTKASPRPNVLHVHLCGTATRPHLDSIHFLSCLSTHGVVTVALNYEWGDFDLARNRKCEDDSSSSSNANTKGAGGRRLADSHGDICVGGDRSGLSGVDGVGVHPSASIVSRLVNLLRFLAQENKIAGTCSNMSTSSSTVALNMDNESHIRSGEAPKRTYPDFAWEEFLVPSANDGGTSIDSGGEVRAACTKEVQVAWDKVILSGHSQGAGHAAYLAQRVSLRHCVLFSGPQEGCQEEPHHWLDAPFATTSIVAFKHKNEEGSNDIILRSLARINTLNHTRVPVTEELCFSLGCHSSSLPHSSHSSSAGGIWETLVSPRCIPEGEAPYAVDRPTHLSTIMDVCTPRSARQPEEAMYIHLWAYLLLLSSGCGRS